MLSAMDQVAGPEPVCPKELYGHVAPGGRTAGRRGILLRSAGHA